MADETLMTGQVSTDPATQQTNAGAGGNQQTTQGNADDQNKGGSAADAGASADGKDDKGNAPQGAPEKYEAFKLPEGVTIEADVVGEIEGLAKELNLPQDQAQKVADFVAKREATSSEKQVEAIVEVRNSWAEASKADKEFGGETLNANLAVAQKAMTEFATPEMRQMLNATGLGNHPEVIRTFFRIGKAISEDKLVTGGKGVGSSTGDARGLYPNSQHSA